MEDLQELLSVHLCSLLAPVSLLVLHLLLPGGFLASPLLGLSLLSLLVTLIALLAPFFFLCPVELRFSPVKPSRHYVQAQLSQRQRATNPIPVNPIPVMLRGSFLQVFLASIGVYIIMGTLLGANPCRQLLATVVWALLMTSLTSVPTMVLLDVDWGNCVRVLLHRIFLNSAERALYIMIMFTLLGAWLGAVPIPLDWNRPWQVWPIPCACGAVLGSVLGSGCSLLAQHYSLYPTKLCLQSRWHSSRWQDSTRHMRE